VRQRTIGTTQVGAIGLGAMPLSVAGHPSPSEADRVVHAALDAGVTLIDTADAYSVGLDDFGAGEEVVARALRSWGGDRDAVLVATKGGHTREADGEWTLNGRPAYLRQAAEASVPAPRRRGDRPVPVPPPRSRGPVRRIGRRAQGARRRGDDPDGRHLERRPGAGPALARRSSATRWSASRTRCRRPTAPASPSCASAPSWGWRSCPGARSAAWGSAAELGSRHAAFAEVARARGVSPQQVCLAWLLAKAPVVIPIPGSSRPETILDSAAAAELDLTAEELERLG
jgi:hypothetical protein